MYKDKIIELCIFHIDEKDNRIQELQAEINVYIKSRDKRINMIKELKAENERLNKGSNVAYMEMLDRSNDKLKADNKRLNDKDGLYDEVKELQAENKELKECISNEGVTMLQDDNKRLMSDNKKRLNEIIELQAENKRLIKQVSSDSGNSSSSHTIQREIAEYMSHNDKCGGARLFLIPRDEFKHGEYDNTIYWEDGME